MILTLKIINFLKKKRLFFKALKVKRNIYFFISKNKKKNLKFNFSIIKHIFYYRYNLKSIKFCCLVSGRYRGVINYFGLSRFIINNKLSLSQLPGYYI